MTCFGSSSSGAYSILSLDPNLYFSHLVSFSKFASVVKRDDLFSDLCSEISTASLALVDSRKLFFSD